MYEKLQPLILLSLLLGLVCYPVQATTDPEKEPAALNRLKATVAKIGTGPHARVKVKLFNKTELKGYITAIGDDAFTVTDGKTRVATSVSYYQVRRVSRNSFSPAAIIGVVLVVGMIVAIVVLQAKAD